MADSKKEEGREDDDHIFDHTDLKKEDAGHGDEEVAGHDDDDDDHPFDYIDSKKEEAGHGCDEVNDEEEDDSDEDDDGYQGDDDEPFDYNLQLVFEVAYDVWKEDFPDTCPGDSEERSPPLQSPQDCSHGVAKKKLRSSPKKRSKTKMKRVSPPASSSNSDDKLVKSSSSSSSSRGKATTQQTASTSHTTDSDDHVPDNHPFRTIDVLADVATDIRFEATSDAAPSRATRERRSDVSRSRTRRANANAGSDFAADHQPPLPPTALQAGRTWRDMHREMGGDEVVRIGKKMVHRSDMELHQGRLLLPLGPEAQVFENACPSEKEKINSDDGLQVDVLDFYGKRFPMTCT